MSKTILVVDDEQRLTSLLEAYLSKEGFRVLTAADGRSALDLARSERPDLIVLDIMMPELDGFDFLRQYRKRADTPVILLTARVELGSAMAVAVLVGLLAVLACSVPALRRGPPSAESLRGWRGRALLVLCVVGAVVAGYLAYVETARVEAVCGPVGDCNTVQQSEYARLFGTVPIAWLGLIGYLLIVLAWAVGAHATGTASARARLSLPALSAAGTLFSIYLTFLEPFVIGAVCLWCLTSAVVMGVLLWLTASPARARTFPEASSFREGHRV